MFLAHGLSKCSIAAAAGPALAEVKVITPAKSPERPGVDGTVATGSEIAPKSPAAAGTEVAPKSPAAAAGAEASPKSPVAELNSGAGSSSAPKTGLMLTDIPTSSNATGAKPERRSHAIDVVALGRTSARTDLAGVEPKEDFPTGIILRKYVPSDNSCLFSSVQFSITGYLGTLSHHCLLCLQYAYFL